MAKALVVVESPAKAKTINKYLGRDYKVIASMGHIRDLPKSKLGVDVDNDFAETYESLASRKKVIKELKDAAKDATDIYVATDPDREGEAIGWHITQELAGKKRKFHRLTFNEITKKAVQEALNHPRAIDVKMVAAQRARRVLDRLVGYKISPLLWDKVRRGLSAGRVQSVALKLVCDREREIEAFVPEEYWNLFARLAGPQPPEFDAKLLKKDGDADQGRQRGAVEGDPRGPRARGVDRRRRSRRRNASATPPPPFITSKLQQTARFPVKKTMMLAQQLYEGRHRDPRSDRRAHHLHAHRLGPRRRRRGRRRARVHQGRRSATTTCRRSRTSTRRNRTRRMRTRRSGRRRCSTIRRRCGST